MHGILWGVPSTKSGHLLSEIHAGIASLRAIGLASQDTSPLGT